MYSLNTIHHLNCLVKIYLFVKNITIYFEYFNFDMLLFTYLLFFTTKQWARSISYCGLFLSLAPPPPLLSGQNAAFSGLFIEKETQRNLQRWRIRWDVHANNTCLLLGEKLCVTLSAALGCRWTTLKGVCALLHICEF